MSDEKPRCDPWVYVHGLVVSGQWNVSYDEGYSADHKDHCSRQDIERVEAGERREARIWRTVGLKTVGVVRLWRPKPSPE